MDVLERLSSLAAVPLRAAGDGEVTDVATVESELGYVFPDSLRAVLQTYSAAITFEANVLFVPVERSGLEDASDSLDLTVIYGLAADDWSIVKRNKTYQAQIPSDYLVVGESSGGNQICMDRRSGKVLFWDHEAVSDDEAMTLVADSFDGFVELLRRGPNSVSAPKGIIEGEAFLDI